MELNKELIIDIDELLLKLFKESTVPIHSYGTNPKDKLREKSKELCKALNLIRVKSNSQYELDEKGILAIQDGGIENYLNNMRLDKDLERTVKDLTKKSLKNQVWYNIMYVTVGGLIGGLIGFLTLLVTPNNTEILIQELHKMAEQEADNDDSFQIDIQQMRLEITSLERQIDSLKNTSN